MDETDTESERWRLSRYAPPATGLPDDMIVRLTEQLAAEREEHKLVCDVVEEKLVRMKEQLAAERKGHEMDGQLISSQESEIEKLREQLAADKVKRELAEFQWKEVSKQLAAEREKTNNATDNCMSLSKLLYETRQQLDAALAKVADK